MIPLILLCTAMFLDFTGSQLLPRFIEGNLSSSWNIELIFYLRHMKGIILHLVDYGQNMLMIKIIERNGTKYVLLRYNKENSETLLSKLCGCEKCGSQMVSFNVMSSMHFLLLSCNQLGKVGVMMNEIKNRDNKHIPSNIKDVVDKLGRNSIYSTIPLKESGCLKSLYFDGQRILFEESGTKFLSSCPRNCTNNECNNGKCWPTYPLGPMCDCSATPFGGLNCNDSMIEYKPESVNSYTKESLTNDLYIKLSWIPKVDTKKYCLLNFDYKYGHVTFSIQQNFLLIGDIIAKSLNIKVINFIDVNVTNQGLIIKVNNMPMEFRQALFGNMTVNVGFTETNEKCDTFEGRYYFQYNVSQLRPRLSSNISRRKLPDVTTTSIINITWTLIIIAGLSLLTACIFIILVCLARKKTRKLNGRGIIENTISSQVIHVANQPSGVISGLLPHYEPDDNQSSGYLPMYSVNQNTTEDGIL